MANLDSDRPGLRCQKIGRQRNGHRTTGRGAATLRRAIVVLAVLALGRTVWLASLDASESPTARTVAKSIETPRGENSRYENQKVHQAEVDRLVAEISLVCPSAGRELEQELSNGTPASLPSSTTQLVAHQAPAAQATITGIRAVRAPLRVAMKPRSGRKTPARDWLVDPSEWLAPEDTPASSQATAKDPTPAAPTPAAPKNEPMPAVPLRETAEEPIPLETPPVIQTPPRIDTPPVEEPAPVVVVPPMAEVLPELKLAPVVESPAVVKATPPVPAPLPVRENESPQVIEAPAPIAPPARAPVPVEPSVPMEPSPPRTSGFAPPPLGMPSVHSLEGAREKAAALGIAAGEDPHAELLAKNCFPSARTCAKCHEKIYNEWSCSSHAYAQISPMFHKFEQRLTELSQGTVGYFCQRCHSPVGTSMNIARDMPLWQQPEVAREGVTCIACHRVNQRYGKANGERHIVPGDENAPVYGPFGGSGVAEVIARKNDFKVKTSPDEKGPGQRIHREGRYFDQLSASEYCTACHQVAVHPGIKLEVVWEQYRASPARKRGVTCQNCHMGKVPGIASGYEYCAVAEVAGKKIHENRKHSNHNFYGPGYSIAHPGIFPHHLKANRWSIDEWLAFDWRGGWGTDAFEDRLADGPQDGPPLPKTVFPPVWAEADDRYDAREIIDDNLKKLAGKTELRRQVMENGSHVDGPFFKTPPRVGQDLVLHYVVANTNDGHNLPTGSLGAQPQLWANVVLIGPRGQRLWETGYTDQHGDVCDIHSRDVRDGRVPFDSQLFNLQTMFLITGATGTDREFFLPVNLDIDQLAFLRPGAIPITVTNHPPFIRMESRSLAPLGKKDVKYHVPGHLLRERGRYRLSFRLRSRLEPIYFMDFVGATSEMKRAMNDGLLDVHPYSVEFDVR